MLIQKNEIKYNMTFTKIQENSFYTPLPPTHTHHTLLNCAN